MKIGENCRGKYKGNRKKEKYYLHSETKIEPDLRLTDHWINALKKKNHNKMTRK